ncbi:MAG: hypothetical protein AB4041_03410 [Microcystaceae cyanobacterium]
MALTDLHTPRLTEKHVLLLQAYKQERNKSQAQQAIYYCTGRELSFGRHVLPLTQQLIDLGYIKRTNPNASSKKGHTTNYEVSRTYSVNKKNK